MKGQGREGVLGGGEKASMGVAGTGAVRTRERGIASASGRNACAHVGGHDGHARPFPPAVLERELAVQVHLVLSIKG